jgi:hypothetical protein
MQVNPYESPRENQAVAPRPLAWLRPFAALLGVLAGYVCLTILANMENFQFYTIRSFVTGEEHMSQIVQHPADEWVAPVLLLVFCPMGAMVGWKIAARRIAALNKA